MTNRINLYVAVRPILAVLCVKTGLTQKAQRDTENGRESLSICVAVIPPLHLCGSVGSGIVRSLSDSKFNTVHFRFLWSNNIVSI